MIRLDPLLFGSITVWFHCWLVPLLVGLEGGFERMV
jgi:hypothetical protein